MTPYKHIIFAFWISQKLVINSIQLTLIACRFNLLWANINCQKFSVFCRVSFQQRKVVVVYSVKHHQLKSTKPSELPNIKYLANCRQQPVELVLCVSLNIHVPSNLLHKNTANNTPPRSKATLNFG